MGDLIGGIYVNFAICLGHKEEYDDAIKAINQCIVIHPTYYKAYSTLGVLYGLIKEYENAIAQYEYALTLRMSDENKKDIQKRIKQIKQQQIEEEEESESYIDCDYQIESDEYDDKAKQSSQQKSVHKKKVNGRGVKGTSLDERIMDTSLMSSVQLKAYNERSTNVNGFYYRFNVEGEQQIKGDWSQTEDKLFKKLAIKKGVNCQWGLFSKSIPGRVGYICSNYWKKLIKDGAVKDENYVIASKNGKEVRRFLKKKEVMEMEEAKNNPNFFDDFRRYQFTVFEDPSGTFKNLPCQHPKAPIKRQNVNQMKVKKVKKKRKRNRASSQSVQIVDDYDFDNDEDFDINMETSNNKKERKKRRKEKKKRKKERKERKRKQKRKRVNDEFLCPINFTLMTDPVIVRQSGWTYDREAITEWICANGTDPNTRAVTSVDDLIPNRALLKAIENWKKDAGHV